MFREIRTRERISDLDERERQEELKRKGLLGYQQIKPENGTTYEEAKAFVEGLFTGVRLGAE